VSINLKNRLLIVDDDVSFLHSLDRALKSQYTIVTATSKSELFQQLSPTPDVVLLDMRLDENDPDNFEGMEILERLKKIFPQIPVIMFTAYGDMDSAVKSMKLGASDFVSKRVKLNELRVRIDKAIEQSQVSYRAETLKEQLDIYEPRTIIGSHPLIIEVKKMIKAVAEDGEVTVLIRGETGTGKELVARAIHATGARRDHSFVPVILGAIPQKLVESELFGAEPGAFTDARELRKGYIEKAHRGVLFLDEIGELDSETQIKLLRFLEEKEFQRLGGTEPIKVDEQVIAATNADLEQLLEREEFREDLYHRLKVVEINIPPIRERREDIPELVSHFLNLLKHRGKKAHHISKQAIQRLQNSAWPGNVRQLKNEIESASFCAELRGDDQIQMKDLPEEVIREESELEQHPIRNLKEDKFDINEELARTELIYIEKALKQADGIKEEAWKLLGYSNRNMLYRRVHRLLQKYPRLVELFPEIAKSFSN